MKQQVRSIVNVVEWKSDENSFRKVLGKYRELEKRAAAGNKFKQAAAKYDQISARTAEIQQRIINNTQHKVAQINKLKGQERRAEEAHMKKMLLMDAKLKAQQERRQRSPLLRDFSTRNAADLSRLNNMFGEKIVGRFQSRISDLQARRSSMAPADYTAQMNMLKDEMRQVRNGAKEFRSALHTTAQGVQTFNSTFNRFVRQMSYVSVGVGAALAKIMSVAGEDNSTRNSFLALNNDNATIANDQLQWTRDKADEYGVSRLELQKDYMKFFGGTKESMDEKTRRGLFESLMVKSTSMGLTSDQQSLAAKALVQSAGKNKVTMEELRQQLGDHIPSAVQDFYKAWQIAYDKAGASQQDFEKAVGKGQVQLQKLAPALTDIWSAARSTEAFANSLQDPTKELQRLKNSLTDMSLSFFGTIDASDGVTSVAESLSVLFKDLSSFMKENEGDIKEFGEGFGKFLWELQCNFWEFYYLTLEPFGRVLKKMNITPEGLADTVGLILKLKAVSSVASAIIALTTAIINLGKVSRTLAAGGLGAPGGGMTGKVGGALSKAGHVGMMAYAGSELAGWGLNSAFGDSDYFQRIRSANTFSDFFAGIFGQGKAGWTTDENGNRVWKDERTGSGFGDMIRSWAQPADMYRPTVRPTPSGANNAALSAMQLSQSLELKGDGTLTGNFTFTMDESGVFRVVDQRVESALQWERVREANSLATDFAY